MGLMNKILCKLAGINEELQQIYEERGICDEYIDKYRALHSKKLQDMDCLILAGMYTSRERYSESQEMIDRVKIGFMTDDTIKGVYYLEKMNLLIGLKKGEEALDIFIKNQKFLDIFYSAPSQKRRAIAYYDTAAVVLAMNGRLEAAGYYYQLEQKSAETYDITGTYPKLTNVHMLKEAGNDEMAAEEAEKTRQYIENYDSYKFAWQKADFIRMLDSYMK